MIGRTTNGQWLMAIVSGIIVFNYASVLLEARMSYVLYYCLLDNVYQYIM
jgi:hypothetical protein